MPRCVVLLLLMVCAGAAEIPDIRFEPIWPKLSFAQPLCVVHADDGSPRLFVAERGGRVWSVPTGQREAAQPTVFIDVRDRVVTKGMEEGLLAVVFHPKFKDNRAVFIYWMRDNPLRTIVTRFRATEDLQRIDPASEETLLEIAQPYENHNGSSLLFGPDGFLYLGPGDGGSGGDPHDNAQNLGVLLGKVLRIDVDHADNGRKYAIPKDNPFVGKAGARGEIWAYGMRNPWRMSFDRKTGELWAGDVGQDKWEEIDVIVKGGNYGWRLREGTHPFKDAPHEGQLIEPVIDYGRDVGASVTGGYVYRGARFPALQGVYVYADYATGRVLGLRREDGKVVAQRQILDSHVNIASFGETADGELLVCAFDGRVYGIVPAK